MEEKTVTTELPATLPQEGSTTGVWRRAVDAAEKISGGRRDYRRGGPIFVPLWFRVLKEFGLPTLFALILLSFMGWMMKADREDRQLDRQAFSEGFKKVAESFDGVKVELKALKRERTEDELDAAIERFNVERERRVKRRASR